MVSKIGDFVQLDSTPCGCNLDDKNIALEIFKTIFTPKVIEHFHVDCASQLTAEHYTNIYSFILKTIEDVRSQKP